MAKEKDKDDDVLKAGDKPTEDEKINATGAKAPTVPPPEAPPEAPKAPPVKKVSKADEMTEMKRAVSFLAFKALDKLALAEFTKLFSFLKD